MLLQLLGIFIFHFLASIRRTQLIFANGFKSLLEWVKPVFYRARVGTEGSLAGVCRWERERRVTGFAQRPMNINALE